MKISKGIAILMIIFLSSCGNMGQYLQGNGEGFAESSSDVLSYDNMANNSMGYNPYAYNPYEEMKKKNDYCENEDEDAIGSCVDGYRHGFWIIYSKINDGTGTYIKGDYNMGIMVGKWYCYKNDKLTEVRYFNDKGRQVDVVYH